MKLATKESLGDADQLLRTPELEDATVDEHADAIGERRGVLEVVGDEERRHPQLSQELVQLRAHGAARVRVERRQRLVEEEDVRLARERASKCDALALAAGELGHARARELDDSQPLEQLRHCCVGRVRRTRRSRRTSRWGNSAYS